MQVPSGWKATQLTMARCSKNVCTQLLEFKSQSLTVLSSLPEMTSLSSAEMAASLTQLMWLRRERSGWVGRRMPAIRRDREGGV